MATANIKAVITAEDRASGALSKFSDNAQDMSRNIAKGLGAASVALGAIGVGLTAFAKNATDFATDFYKDSVKLGREIGVTTQEASRLVAAVSRMGITAEDASTVFGIFSKKIVAHTEDVKSNALATDKLKLQVEKTKHEIAETTAEIKKNGDKTGELSLTVRTLRNELAEQENQLKQNVDGFAKLGISTVDAAGNQKDFNSILFEVADRFKAMPDGIDKTAIALELFGRSGKDMIKVLNLGSEGIKQLEAQADKLGITLTAKNIASTQKYIESQKMLKQNTDALKLAVAELTTPYMTRFNEKLSQLIERFNASDSPLKQIIANVLAFGGPLASAASAALGAAAGVAALVAAGVSLATLGAVAGVVIALAGAAYLLFQHAGSLNGALATVRGWLSALGEAIQTHVGPSLQVLTNTISTQLMPALVALWQQIGPVLTPQLKALAVAILAALVASLWVAVNALNVIIGVISALINIVTAAVAPFVRLSHAVGSTFADIVNIVRSAVNVIPGIINSAIQKAEGIINGLKGAFRSAGAGLMQALADGILSGASAPYNAVKGVLNGVKALLPGSDAKEGPLSRLTHSGRMLSETFAKGIGQGSGAIKNAVANSLMAPSADISSSSSGMITPSLAQAAQISTAQAPINITVQAGAFMGSQQDARRYAKMIMDAWNDLQSSQGVTA